MTRERIVRDTTTVGIRSEPPEGITYNDPIESRVGVGDGEAVAVIDSIAGPRGVMITRAGFIHFTDVPFSAGTVLGVGRDRMVFADQERFELRIRDSEGALLRVVRATLPRAPLGADFFRAAISHAEATGTMFPVAEFAEAGEYPDSIPHFGDVIVDETGRIWLADFLPDASFSPRDEVDWTVLDPDGVPIARIRMATADDIQEIGEDYILVRERDEFDVEYVRMYGIEVAAVGG